ncbi:FixH family protein [Algoriphagus sp. AGSA1]|uniref:FixH family protein n=1 Tax=Algoriphagus sp. AGSA1 TaxID=2907213 RepID=UPI001F214304|nr:FixH family protein [Algoriphagus sp. AGSA1]MCE7054840.1 FixH family protein [Algoriphagus sp. AGSA1]
MNWGKGIFLTILAFVALIMAMVIFSVRMEGIELVTENYYEEEINYQDRIDNSTSANALDRTVISYDSQLNVLILDLPIGTRGELQFFRPSDSSLDQEIKLEVNQSGMTKVSLKDLKPGYWKIQLKWEENGVDYYQEKKINL